MRPIHLISLIGLISCSPALNLVPTNASLSSSETLKIIPLDIGQGDSTLIITPSHKIILIDGGPIDTGTNVILPYLQENGINHIDSIFASQYDADHIAGLSEVIAGFDGILETEDDYWPEAVWDRGGEKEEGGTVFNNYLEAAGSLRTSVSAGETWTIEDNLTIQCLIVNGELANGTHVELEEDDENSHSLGLLLTFGEFRYWTSGDLPGGGLDTLDLESAVAPLIGEVDILHVNHHGSESSTNQNFLDTLSPTLALISTGDDNNYGHPANTVLGRLDQAGIQVILTEEGNGGFLENEIVANGPTTIEAKEDGTYTTRY